MRLSEKGQRDLAAYVRQFPHVHQGIGLLGNALFFTGTVLFIADLRDVGLYFFLAGSTGMLLGSLGAMIGTAGRRKLRRDDVNPSDPDLSWSGQPR